MMGLAPVQSTAGNGALKCVGPEGGCPASARRECPVGHFSALTRTNRSTIHESAARRSDKQGTSINVFGSMRCLLSRRAQAARVCPGRGRAVAAAESADAL